jgi:hypothetical protein
MAIFYLHLGQSKLPKVILNQTIKITRPNTTVSDGKDMTGSTHKTAS